LHRFFKLASVDQLSSEIDVGAEFSISTGKLAGSRALGKCER
jgi:hypothetical protein